MHITRAGEGPTFGNLTELIGRSAATGRTDKVSIAASSTQPGETGAWHYHSRTTEVYHILSGNGIIRVGKVEKTVNAGDTIMIAPGELHSLSCPADANEPIVFMAICTPAWTPNDHHVVEPSK